MLNAIKKLFGVKPAETSAPEVPYKVETPSVSPASEQAVQAVVESLVPAKKAPAKKTAAKKPAAKKPRAPKASKVAK